MSTILIIHRDIDIDRDRVAKDDRQRNEIKTYSSSEEAVKGYENETFVYRSILDLDNLRPDEEIVRSANFSVSEVMLAN